MMKLKQRKALVPIKQRATNKIASRIVYLCLGFVVLHACAVRKISDAKISRNADAINFLADYLISSKISQTNLDSIKDKEIRSLFKALKIQDAEVHTLENNYFSLAKSRDDTLVSFTRHGVVFFSYAEIIILDRRRHLEVLKRNKEFEELHFNNVKDNIFYRNYKHGPM